MGTFNPIIPWRELEKRFTWGPYGASSPAELVAEAARPGLHGLPEGMSGKRHCPRRQWREQCPAGGVGIAVPPHTSARRLRGSG